MSIKQLFQDYNINYITEGNKHCTEGWINVHCPFCSGNRNYHLGINENGNSANCWRCGTHPITEALGKILNLSPSEVKRLIVTYKTKTSIKIKNEPKISIFPFKFPEPHTKLNSYGKKYLLKRNFDPEYLEKEWGLRQTGPVSFLDGISYANRILIPVKWKGEIVTFQGRDMTEKSERKYLACPQKREKVHHKNIIYGKEEYWSKAKSLVIVEGVTDVWRLGKRAVATFGTSFKMEQVLELSKICDKYFVIFDGETHAQEQARKMATKLKTLGKKVFIEVIKGDPGEMKQNEANYLIKNLK
jgi:hypothetical protein